MKTHHYTVSAKETEQLAEQFGRSLTTGGVIALYGTLGSGKTTFVKGLARGVGVTSAIQSPTFILMNVHDIRHHALKTLVHVDCYRLDSVGELREIGLEDYLVDPSALMVIEWAEKAKGLIPKKCTKIRFGIEPDHTHLITIEQSQSR